MDHEEEEYEEVHFDEDEEEPMDSDGEDMGNDEDRNAQYGDEEEIENATFIFDRHTSPVQVVLASPCGRYIATGGEDDRGFVVDTTNAELVIAFFGHKESIVALAWNCDSSLVASADLNGDVKVWSMKDKKVVFSANEGGFDRGGFLKFHTVAPNALVVALEDGNIYMYNVKDGNFKMYTGPVGVACRAGEFIADNKQLLVLYEDGSVRNFDLKTQEVLSTAQGKSNEAISLSVGKNYSLVGFADCTIGLVASTPEGLKFADHFKPEKYEKRSEGEESHPIEAADIYDGQVDLFAAASLSGFVYIYESRKIRLKLLHPDGVNKVRFIPGDKPRVITSCLDGKVRIWDCRSGDLLITLHGHRDQILDMTLIGQCCATASDDNTVRYWDLNELEENPSV